MLKKTTLAMLGLAFNGCAVAGMYSEPPAPSCTPGDVTVPCVANNWELGIQALYLKPTYTGSSANAANVAGTIYQDTDPKWGWGYRLQGSYFYNTGSYLSANWTHYDVDSRLGGAYLGNFQISPAVTLPQTTYSLYTTNQFDQVNVVAGQHVDMGLLKNARFYAGMQFAKVRVDNIRSYAFPTVSAPIAAILTASGGVQGRISTDYNGFGPTVGIDYSYDLAQNFSLTANTATSILYGTARRSASTVFLVGGTPYTQYGSRKKMVPSFEAKLGANYAYVTALGVLNIEGGYQAINYFNMLESAPLIGSTALTSSNFGLYGPYFGVKWLGVA